jgi:hypothetical protein
MLLLDLFDAVSWERTYGSLQLRLSLQENGLYWNLSVVELMVTYKKHDRHNMTNLSVTVIL